MNHAAEIKPRRAQEGLDRVRASVARWNEFAEAVGVSEDWREGIGRQLA